MSRRAKTSSLSRLAKHGSQWVSRLPKSYRDAIAQASLVDSVGATASGLLAWRDALLEGKTPTTGRWPAGALGQQLVEWCEQSGVLPHCRNNPELVDLVVLAMLQLILQAQRRGLQQIDQLLRQWVQDRQALPMFQVCPVVQVEFHQVEFHRVGQVGFHQVGRVGQVEFHQVVRVGRVEFH